MSGSREKLGRTMVKIQPWLLRRGDLVYRPLRRLRPVLRIKKAVIVTRHTDVQQVLERDDVFSVTYAEHMEQVTGPFILGWDDGPRYRHEVGALRAAVRGEDLPALAAMTRERAADLVAGGAVDGVTLADEAVGVGLDRYFGLAELADAGHREAARTVFRAVFLDADVPDTVAAGKAASDRLEQAIGAAMARHRAADVLPDTVLGRLLQAGDLEDEAIVRNLVGLTAAWAASVPRAFALALDALLDRPGELARTAGFAADGDEQAVARLWLEALRMQPQAPFLLRKARAELVLAPGSPREEHIRPGDVVVAVTHSAMHDPRTLDAPEAFSHRRPDDDYLHFGAGIHRCFGAAISMAQFGALGTVLLRGGRPARTGALRWGAAFPAALPVRVAAGP